MQARFRIRTAEGLDLEPRTMEILAEMVRSGVVRPEDLVFDALTARWVEVARHPMFQLLRDPLALAPDAPGHPFDLGILDSSGPSAEEAEAAFIRRMEEERRSDPDRLPLALELPLVADSGPRPGLELAEPREAPRRAPASTPRDSVATAPPRHRSERGAPWWGRLAAGGVAVGALALLRGPDAAPPAALPTAMAAAAPAARSVEMTREEKEVRSRARTAFLARVSELGAQAGLAEVPPDWLEGRYLADPAAHPEVRRYWEEVKSFSDRIERTEEELYREAWLRSAEGLGLSGPVRSLRMAAALEDFTGSAPLRAEHYRQVREVAASSLALHALLLELGDRVTYEPMRGGGLSADPVLEAAGRDPAAQSLLEEALDRVLAALRGPGRGSPERRARLAEWMTDVPF